MAAKIAERVFGPSHTIESAGAETSPGGRAARLAITALRELGLDLSKHVTTRLQDLNPASYDQVVVFRPSRRVGFNS
jgi:protein-tyrosine-phosphatase